MNLGKKTINVGNGMINLGENFINSLSVSYRDMLDDFHETASNDVANRCLGALKGRGRLTWQRLQAPPSGDVASRPSCADSAARRQAGRSPGLSAGLRRK